MKNLISVSVLFLFCIGCVKDNMPERPMSQNEIWNCYHDSEWSEEKVRDALIGKWRWIYTENYWAPEERRNTENENTVFEFFIDSTLQISENGEQIGTTKWIVSPEDGELFGVKLDSTITHLLYGRILICGEILEFNDSYIDGSDNYFNKIE